MQPYLELLLLAAIVVFIVDVSGFFESLKGGIGRLLGKNIEHLKPFDCSLCMTWWTGLVYLAVTHHLSLYSVAFLAVLASCSVAIGNMIVALRMVLHKAADWVMDRFE